MSKINFPKKQEQRLIPKYLLEYSEELVKNHPDPSESWGGSGSTYTAGEGIVIENNEISVDAEDVALVKNLATVAFSGSYSDLSNKPDLSVYELKEDAFSGDYNDLTNKPTLFSGNYNDLTNKPDLSVYELKSEAFSGNYNDLTNKPTIPTDTSDLTNGAGYITGIDSADVITALGYTPGTSNFSGNYNDLTNKPTIPDAVSGTNDGTNWTTITIGNTTKNIPAGGSSYTAGTGIDITNDVISIDNTVALKTDIPTVPTNISSFTNDAGYITGINSTDVITALGYTPGTSNFSGDYTDLTNKPTIPTATSQLTNDSGFVTNSALNNMVTTDTTQQITGEKTFIGDKRIKFKQSTFSNKLGFTCYNYNNQEKGFLEYNPTDNGLYLGRYGDYRVNELGFKTNAIGGTHKLLVPNVTLSGTKTDYIPISVNNTKADSTGNISIAIPTVPTNVSAFTNDAGYITGITSSDITTALGYTPGTSNFSGSYTDLTDKPTIPPTVSGTNDGTNWTSLTIGNDTYNIPSGGGGSTNMWYHKIHIVTNYNNSYQLLYAEMILPTSSQITTIAGLFSAITQDDNPNAVLFGQYRRTTSIPNTGLWTGNSTVFIAVGKNPIQTSYSGYLITNIGVTGSSASITYGNNSTQNIAWSNISTAVEGTEYNHATYREFQCWDTVTAL